MPDTFDPQNVHPVGFATPTTRTLRTYALLFTHTLVDTYVHHCLVSYTTHASLSERTSDVTYATRLTLSLSNVCSGYLPLHINSTKQYRTWRGALWNTLRLLQLLDHFT